MKILINQSKLAELHATKPHLVQDIIRVLESAVSLPQHRSTLDALLNCGVAVKIQSESDSEPIYP